MVTINEVPDMQLSDGIDPALIIVYLYLLIGGILSPFYFWGAVMKSDLLHFLTSPMGIQNVEFAFGTIARLLFNAMLRVLAWAPDLVRSVMLGPQTAHDWFWGIKALTIVH